MLRPSNFSSLNRRAQLFGVNVALGVGVHSVERKEGGMEEGDGHPLGGG